MEQRRNAVLSTLVLLAWTAAVVVVANEAAPPQAPRMAPPVVGMTAPAPAPAGTGAQSPLVSYRPHIASCRKSYTSLATCLNDQFKRAATDVVDIWNVNEIAGLQTHEFARAAHSITHTAYELMKDCMTQTKYISKRRAELGREQIEHERLKASGRTADTVRAAVGEQAMSEQEKLFAEREGVTTESIFQWIVNGKTPPRVMQYACIASRRLVLISLLDCLIA